MEVREGGFTVAGLPKFGVILVEPSGDSFRIVTAGEAFTPDEWREFTDACVYVRDRLAGFARPAAPSSTGPWARIEDVPASVNAILDRENDGWSRGSDGSWDGEPPEYLNRFAPFMLRR